jgi:hypothetical protein
VFPLSFLFCGLGFLGVLAQREHRALHDLIAGTAVIYAWDARAARLRFLAREAEVGADSGSRRRADSEGRDNRTGPAPLSSDAFAASRQERPDNEDVQGDDA